MSSDSLKKLEDFVSKLRDKEDFADRYAATLGEIEQIVNHLRTLNASKNPLDVLQAGLTENSRYIKLYAEFFFRRAACRDSINLLAMLIHLKTPNIDLLIIHLQQNLPTAANSDATRRLVQEAQKTAVNLKKNQQTIQNAPKCLQGILSFFYKTPSASSVSTNPVVITPPTIPPFTKAQ